MVLQAYGSAVSGAAPQEGAAQGSRGGSLRALGAAVVGLTALAAVVVTQLPSSVPRVELEQHLMSANSRDAVWSQSHDKIFETEGGSVKSRLEPWTGKSTHAFDRLQGLSSRPVDEALSGIKHTLADSLKRGSGSNFYGSWGGSKPHQDFYHQENTWSDQMDKLKQRQAARREKENSAYFKGVDKAFGKKAGKAMEDAFDGSKGGKADDKVISKVRLSGKQIEAHKAAIADGTSVPSMKKQDVVADRQHKSRVVKKSADLKHLGVVADTQKMQRLVHEAKQAHGKRKQQLKARVMQLQQDIVGAFKRVTKFGKDATTELARETAKEKAKKKASKHSDD
uniref:Uncharacterized protein n=1 Tax=Hemiselmis tepida TaxID=464990 RepID=A0A7S0VEW3_9CRYP